MTKNIGTVDKIIRVILALVLLYAAWVMYNGDSLILAVVLAIIGLLVLITAITGFCFLYKVAGINTEKSSTPPSQPAA